MQVARELRSAIANALLNAMRTVRPIDEVWVPLFKLMANSGWMIPLAQTNPLWWLVMCVWYPRLTA